MRAYRLKRDGQIVHTNRSSSQTPSGRTVNLTKAVVGHAGQVFTDLPEHVVAEIDSGQKEDVWEVVELDGEATEEMSAVVPLTDDERVALMELDLRAMEPEDLQNVADRLGLTIEGSGTANRVLKRDLVAAIENERARMGQES